MQKLADLEFSGDVKELNKEVLIIAKVPLLDGTGRSDGDLLRGPAASSASLLDFLDNIHALYDLSEYNMLTIELQIQNRSVQVLSRKQLLTHGVLTVVTKNCEPLVPGPALAIESRPGVSCL